MEYQYYEECERCMHVFGSVCVGHEVPSTELKRYPPTDLEEATRALRPDEYCASCGYPHKGWPGASCGQPQ